MTLNSNDHGKGRRNNSGFTLVEIIAVLMLIGILAAVALPRYADLMDSGRQEVGKSKIAEMRGAFTLALASYQLKNNGAKPDSGATLLGHYNTVSDAPCTEIATSDQNQIEYACSGSGSDTTITVTVTAVNGAPLSTSVKGDFTY